MNPARSGPDGRRPGAGSRQRREAVVHHPYAMGREPELLELRGERRRGRDDEVEGIEGGSRAIETRRDRGGRHRCARSGADRAGKARGEPGRRARQSSSEAEGPRADRRAKHPAVRHLREERRLGETPRAALRFDRVADVVFRLVDALAARRTDEACSRAASRRPGFRRRRARAGRSSDRLSRLWTCSTSGSVASSTCSKARIRSGALQAVAASG